MVFSAAEGGREEGLFYEEGGQKDGRSWWSSPFSFIVSICFREAHGCLFANFGGPAPEKGNKHPPFLLYIQLKTGF